MNRLKSIFFLERPGDALKEWITAGNPLPSFFELAASIPAGPAAFHSGSVLDHLARCMNEVAGNPLTVWMAFAHDAGKLTTPSEMLPHHYCHEVRGVKLIPIWVKELCLTPDYAFAGILTSRLHMKAGIYKIMKRGKQYDLFMEVYRSGLMKEFWSVVDADTKSDISKFALAATEIAVRCSRDEYCRMKFGKD